MISCCLRDQRRPPDVIALNRPRCCSVHVHSRPSMQSLPSILQPRVLTLTSAQIRESQETSGIKVTPYVNGRAIQLTCHHSPLLSLSVLAYAGYHSHGVQRPTSRRTGSTSPAYECNAPVFPCRSSASKGRLCRDMFLHKAVPRHLYTISKIDLRPASLT